MINEKHIFSLPKHPFLTQDHDPHRILAELFSSYTIEDIRIIMWEKLKAELDSEYYKSAKERSDAIFFFETVLTALEAVYVVHAKNEKVMEGKSKPKKRGSSRKRT